MVNYNNPNSIENRGFVSIRTLTSAPATAATLYVPGSLNIFNRAGATWEIYYGNLQQCRFAPSLLTPPTICPDSGTPQGGKFDNEGGIMNVTSSFVETSQDQTNLSGGLRTIIDTCLKTGVNYSQSGSTSVDTITNSSFSVGWQFSGNVSYEGTLIANGVRFQLAGSSGNFQLNSGSISGSINYIYLKNHVTGVAGGGGISASSSVTGTVALPAYLAPVSNYLPSGKFTGTQTLTDQPVSGVTYFPDTRCDTANRLPPAVLAASLVITKSDGKSTTSSGGTNPYVVTLTNNGPSVANGVVLTDVVGAGLTCPPANPVVCSVVTIGAVCPAGPLTFANLTPPSVITIATFPANSALQFAYTCNVN